MVGNRGRENDQALIQEGTQQHMHDGCLGGGCAADEDGGHADEAHLQRCGISLQIAEALGVDDDADGTQHGGQGNALHAHLVHINAAGTGKGGIGTGSGDGNAGLGTEVQVDEQAGNQHGQNDTGGDVHGADVEAQEVVQQIAEGGLHGNGVTNAHTAQRPDDLAAVEGSTEPDDAHQVNGGIADVGGNGHFAALNQVQKLAVSNADHPGNDCCNDHGKEHGGPGTEARHHRIQGGGNVELDGQQCAQQAADDAKTDTEVGADAALDGGDHGQNQNAPHAEILQRGREIGCHIDAVDSSGDDDGCKEAENDQSGQADDIKGLLEFFFCH